MGDSPTRPSFSKLADEFRMLDMRRRRYGLSLADVGRYQALCSQLSDALATMEKNRRLDARQFLRVPFAIQIVVRRPQGQLAIECHDFGGGGCAIRTTESFKLHEDVWVDGATLGGVHY